MGELEPWIDENFVRNVWFQLGENVNVKMIRDKFSGYLATLLGCLGDYANIQVETLAIALWNSRTPLLPPRP
jgi:hypothetical protein